MRSLLIDLLTLAAMLAFTVGLPLLMMTLRAIVS